MQNAVVFLPLFQCNLQAMPLNVVEWRRPCEYLSNAWIKQARSGRDSPEGVQRAIGEEKV